MSHSDALNYYIIVSLQTKEVTGLVKIFSSRLSVFNKDSSAKNQGGYDSIKRDYYELINQLDKRTRILEDLPAAKEIVYLKHPALNYIKDPRDILVNDVFKVINLNRIASNKSARPSQIERHSFISRKEILIIDDMLYKKMSEIFRKQYHIIDDELIKYGL
jgi:hypothetical protein